MWLGSDSTAYTSPWLHVVSSTDTVDGGTHLKKAGMPVLSMVEATAAAVIVVELSIGAAGLRIESRISMQSGSSEAVRARAGVAEMGSLVLCARRRSRVS